MTIKECAEEAFKRALQDSKAAHQLTTTASLLRSIDLVGGRSMRLSVALSDGSEKLSLHILDNVFQASDEDAWSLISTIGRAVDVGGHAFLWNFFPDRTECRFAIFQDYQFCPVSQVELSSELPDTIPLMFEAESQKCVGCAWPAIGPMIQDGQRLCDAKYSPLHISFAAAVAPKLTPELMSDPNIRQKHIKYLLPWEYALTVIHSCEAYIFDDDGDWICDGFELVRQGVIRDHGLKPLDPLIGKPPTLDLMDLLDIPDGRTLRRKSNLPFRPTTADYAAEVLPVYLSSVAWLTRRPASPLGDTSMAQVLTERLMQWLTPALIDSEEERPGELILSPNAVRRMARRAYILRYATGRERLDEILNNQPERGPALDDLQRYAFIRHVCQSEPLHEVADALGVSVDEVTEAISMACRAVLRESK